MSYVNLNIDGIEISAFKGMTILQVAQENGIDIPNLCNNDKLKVYGSCGLCVVEVENNPRLVRACATDISEGMVIRTWSARIKDSRKTSLELMFSNHTGDCKAPCSQGCPGNVDVQGYVGLTANGEYAEALKLIKENLPLPASIGRVCPHPCQTACRRGLLEDPISIAWIKRYVADLDLASENPYLPEMAPDTGRKIAIVGGGPSGLSAAYFLRTMGHAVTVYESMPEFGGMLKYGIPLYRLPREVLIGEVDVIRKMGVNLVPNVRVGRDLDLNHIRKNHDAVYVAIGAWKSALLNCPGSDLDGVFGGIEFLNKFSVNEPIRTGKRIAVIGGGNTAMDACRTSMRLGAEKVYAVYRRTKEDMPAVDIEIQEAEEEGIEFKFLLNPVEVIGDEQGKVKAIKLQRMQVTEGGRGGKKNVVPVEGDFEIVEVDSVIVSIGQNLDITGLEELELNKWGNIQVDLSTLQTNLEGVFAGGDGADDGATIAIDAINDGKNAARIMDSYLKGKLQPIKPKKFSKRENLTAEDFPGIAIQGASHMGHEHPEVRKGNFEEVVHGYTEAEAKAEGDRCLECGCMDYFECKLIDYGVAHDADPATFPSEKPKYDIVEESPFILRDPNKCILCGMCIRTCEEVMDIGILSFAGRGYTAQAQPAFTKNMLETDCITCGQCISVCPTGALAEKPFTHKPVPMVCDKTVTVCSQCGIGCGVEMETRGSSAVRTLPVKQNTELGGAANDGVLCSKGRFGFGFDKSNRITVPMIRKNGVLVETTMKDALLHVARRAQSMNLLYGKNSVALALSDRMTNEEAWMLNQFGRELLGTEHIFSFNQSENGIKDVLGIDASPNLMDELANADFTLLVGCDIVEDHTIAGLNLKKAFDKGKTVVVLNDGATKADKWAKISLNKLTDLSILKEMALYVAENHRSSKKYDSSVQEAEIAAFVASLKDVKISDQAAEIAEMYMKAPKALIAFDDARISREASRLLAYMAVLSGHLGRAKDGIVMLRPNCNSQGIVDMGTDTNSAEIMNAMEDGKIKAMLVFGEDLDQPTAAKIREKCDFLMVQDVVMTELASLADVVLPQALLYETSGTITSTDRKIQKATAALEPVHGLSNWKLIQELVNIYSTNASFASVEAVTDDLVRKHPLYNGAREALAEGKHYHWTPCTSRILFDGSSKDGHACIKQPVVMGLNVETPTFCAHHNTDITRKLFKEKFAPAEKSCSSCSGCSCSS